MTTETTTDTRDTYERGVLAAKRNIPREWCSYALHTDARRAWQDGYDWAAARIELVVSSWPSAYKRWVRERTTP